MASNAEDPFSRMRVALQRGTVCIPDCRASCKHLKPTYPSTPIQPDTTSPNAQEKEMSFWIIFCTVASFTIEALQEWSHSTL